MKRFLQLGFLALVCASCASRAPMVNTIVNANPVANIQRVEDARCYMDPTFGQILACTEIRESQTNDGYKRVQVFLKNFSTVTAPCNYRFNWYDENGVEVVVPDNEMWKHLNVVPGDEVTLTSIAPSRKCADFKLRIGAGASF